LNDVRAIDLNLLTGHMFIQEHAHIVWSLGRRRVTTLKAIKFRKSWWNFPINRNQSETEKLPKM